MENKGLIFIPDISGFTRFVNETEIDHSRQIIQELLEILINANQTGLAISEIEGDAILFYKFGEAPNPAEIYGQVEKMFCDFHRHLAAYELRRFCQCSACTSAINLTLKVITHYGEFTSYKVKEFSKLIGKDIIVAHQLLKNDIEQHEYWLVTKGLLADKQPADLKQWMNWSSGIKKTETGEIPFHYTLLSELKNEIPPEQEKFYGIPQKVKMGSLSKEYEYSIQDLFFVVGNLDFRHRWLEGVKKIEDVSELLPRVGTRHRCVLENEQIIMYYSSYSYAAEQIVFSETDEKKRASTYFILEHISDKKSRLTMDFYLKKNLLLILFFKLMVRKKLFNGFRQSLINLEKLLKEVEIPVQAG